MRWMLCRMLMLLLISPTAMADVNFSVPVEVGPTFYALDSELVDVDGDGILDLLTARSQSVFLRYGDGEGGFGNPTPFEIVTHAESLATGDFNGDGLIDVVANGSVGGKAGILLGLPDGTFGTRALVNVPDGEGYTVFVGDFNGDDNQDFVTLSYGLHARLFPGDGTGAFGSTSILTELPGAPVVGDFDGDGRSELALIDVRPRPYGRSTISILEASDDGHFVEVKAFSVGDSPIDLDARDFDNNGTVDLLVLDRDRSVHLLPGRGNGNFRPAIVSPALPGRSRIMAITDFNGDTTLDLLVDDHDTNGDYVLSVYSLRSDGRFRVEAFESPEPSTFRVPVTLTVVHIAAGPIDGDERADLILVAAQPRKLLAAYSR